MTDLEIMKHAKDYIDMLANGVNPINGEGIENDSVINNVRISRCLFYVSDVLKKVIDNGGEVCKKSIHRQLHFVITEQQLSTIEITEEPVGIADFAKRINSVIDDNIKPISATIITSWLVQKGYLTENIYNGKRKKDVTQSGTSIGITTIEGVSRSGVQYKKNLYDVTAQRFIVENLNKIAEDTAAQKDNT